MGSASLRIGERNEAEKSEGATQDKLVLLSSGGGHQVLLQLVEALLVKEAGARALEVGAAHLGRGLRLGDLSVDTLDHVVWHTTENLSLCSRLFLFVDTFRFVFCLAHICSINYLWKFTEQVLRAILSTGQVKSKSNN